MIQISRRNAERLYIDHVQTPNHTSRSQTSLRRFQHGRTVLLPTSITLAVVRSLVRNTRSQTSLLLVHRSRSKSWLLERSSSHTGVSARPHRTKRSTRQPEMVWEVVAGFVHGVLDSNLTQRRSQSHASPLEVVKLILALSPRMSRRP